MPKILHISDLHFGPPYVPEVGEALQQIVPTLDPDAIVVSGDLSQRARREQFEEARVPAVTIGGFHRCQRLRDTLPRIIYVAFIVPAIPGGPDVPRNVGSKSHQGTVYLCR